MIQTALLLLAVMASPPTVLTNVQVVGSEGVRPGQTIVIEGDRIVAMGDTATVSVPAGARVVDEHGAFVIPGLWDMHVHLASYPGSLPLLVAYGVTGVRDMGNEKPEETRDLLRWRHEIEAGRRVGPRLVIAGPTLDGRRGFASRARINVAAAAEGARAVDMALLRGADFIKVHDWIRPEAYAAVAKAARARGRFLVGHTPPAIPARDAVAAGQRSIEHLGSSLGGFLLDASSREAELRSEVLRRMDEALKAGSEDAFWKNVHTPEMTRPRLDSWDEAKAAALIAFFHEHGTWQTPTLTVLSPEARPRTTADRRFIFASGVAACAKAAPTAVASTAPELFARQLGVVKAMQAGGVPLLAGTDTATPDAGAIEEFGTCEVPIAGLSVHEELQWLVAAGLTPAQALAAATIEPARYFGEEAVAGTVAVGKRADLVLLEANPLEAIQNTTRIRAVIAAGRLYDRKTLDGLLDDAATDARSR